MIKRPTRNRILSVRGAVEVLLGDFDGAEVVGSDEEVDIGGSGESRSHSMPVYGAVTTIALHGF